ncbi:hypothetical protein [Taibaiella soli]|uniref:Uncharacterized protein n=1 Tax=Taibaiella soli TaxID=1649169 RepID=A0A2W2AGK4_9BACT|nr:hypothetical protein [Taibaiella soli]PZF74391.1 hypothetical protein DN068_02085 [Taibaiella soli]
MKPLLLIAACGLLLGSCKKSSDTKPASSDGAKLVMLKVDYQTGKFEGGKIFTYPAGSYVADSIPIQEIVKPAGDFGNVTLKYIPTGDTVFFGTVIWMGGGQRILPQQLDSSNKFAPFQLSVLKPDSTKVKYFGGANRIEFDPSQNFASIWYSIAGLSVTANAIGVDHAKVGLFLYTPSVGIGDPAEWDYYWLLYIRNSL